MLKNILWRGICSRRLIKQFVVPSQSSTCQRCFSMQSINYSAQKPEEADSGFLIGSALGDAKKSIMRYLMKGVVASRLYESCSDRINYLQFFEACNMPDTMQSWYCVMTLHIWMVLVRLKAEGRPGKRVSHMMTKTMWDDVEARMKHLQVDAGSRGKHLHDFTKQFFGFIVGYDEGLLSNDQVLASALWRNMIGDKHNTDAEKLAQLVGYVRKQMQHLEMLPSETFTTTGEIDWLPLAEEVEDNTFQQAKNFIEPGS